MFPRLIPKNMMQTDIKIILYTDEISEDGEPIKSNEINTKCNFQNLGKVYIDNEHRQIQIQGTALIDRDIAPNIDFISEGEAIIYNKKFKIYQARKNRNPDGTVNYTSLELI